MFNAWPDMLKLLQNHAIHAQLKESSKMINFQEVRKITNEWLDELEKRMG